MALSISLLMLWPAPKSPHTVVGESCPLATASGLRGPLRRESVQAVVLVGCEEQARWMVSEMRQGQTGTGHSKFRMRQSTLMAERGSPEESSSIIITSVVMMGGLGAVTRDSLERLMEASDILVASC